MQTPSCVAVIRSNHNHRNETVMRMKFKFRRGLYNSFFHISIIINSSYLSYFASFYSKQVQVHIFARHCFRKLLGWVNNFSLKYGTQPPFYFETTYNLMSKRALVQYHWRGIIENGARRYFIFLLRAFRNILKASYELPCILNTQNVILFSCAHYVYYIGSNRFRYNTLYKCISFSCWSLFELGSPGSQFPLCMLLDMWVSTAY